MSIFVLAIGSVIATGSQFLLLVPSIRKLGFKYKLVINLDDQHIKMMVVMALPIIISQSVNRINVLVDRTLASSVAVGGISASNYADNQRVYYGAFCKFTDNRNLSDNI